MNVYFHCFVFCLLAARMTIGWCRGCLEEAKPTYKRQASLTRTAYYANTLYSREQDAVINVIKDKNRKIKPVEEIQAELLRHKKQQRLRGKYQRFLYESHYGCAPRHWCEIRPSRKWNTASDTGPVGLPARVVYRALLYIYKETEKSVRCHPPSGYAIAPKTCCAVRWWTQIQ